MPLQIRGTTIALMEAASKKITHLSKSAVTVTITSSTVSIRHLGGVLVMECSEER